MIRGSRIPFLGRPPTLAEGQDRLVKLFPVHETVANGRMGDLGQWVTRPGYEVRTNLDTDAAVTRLHAHNGLVAFTDEGKVFRALDESLTKPVELEGLMQGPQRPETVVHDGEVIAVDGGDPMVVEAGRLRRLGVPRITPGVPRVEATNKGRVPQGQFRYYVSMTTVAGESLVGPASAVVTHTGKGEHGTRVERPDISEDDLRWVLEWSVYRGLYQGNAIALIGTAAVDTLYINDILPAGTGTEPVVDASGSTPVRASECAVVGDYLVLAGHDGTEFRWSSPGNHDLWPDANNSNVQLDGGTIQTIRGITKELIFFRTNAIDLYSLVGGNDVFSRRLTYRRGCLAKKSVVMVGGMQPYWLGDDHIFYRVTSGAPEPIGLLEQEFVARLRSPEACEGDDFPRERVIRWRFPVDGICIGYNYGKGHFFRDWSWDGSKQVPLDVHATCQATDGTTLVGLSAGGIGEWGQQHATDGGRRIRTIRKFTVPLTGDGRQARLNALVFRHERGTHDLRDPLVPDAWQENHDYEVADLVHNPLDPSRVFRCIRDHTSGDSISDSPGIIGGGWETYWRDLKADEEPTITISWGFDQGPQAGRESLSMGTLGDTQPYAVIGPCGVGREAWIEMERSAMIPVAFTGGACIAQPLGDGL